MTLDRENSGVDTVAVVGIGYVGLTLLCALADAGYQGIGYDVNRKRVERTNSGTVPFEGAEPAMSALLTRLVKEGRIRASTDPTVLEEAGAIFIAVETPVDEADHRPRYAALRAALAKISAHLSPGTLLVVESTIAPGTMHGLILEELSRSCGTVGQDYYLAHCPERVMPGRLLQNITSCDRIVGGMTPACTAKAAPVYRRLTRGLVHETDARTAEVVKTAENAYRDVQIAFANELALISEELGVDVYEVRELVNSSPFRQMHLPGAGVGGHCIPKDPWLLCSSVTHYRPSLLPAARAINDGMPGHLVELTDTALAAEGRQLSGALVTILGAAYLEETDDVRNTPALSLARLLAARGTDVQIIDPFVDTLEEFTVRQELEATAGSDALILVTAHEAFRRLDLPATARAMRTPILIDGRNLFSPTAAEAAGFRLRGIGRGRQAKSAQAHLESAL